MQFIDGQTLRKLGPSMNCMTMYGSSPARETS